MRQFTAAATVVICCLTGCSAASGGSGAGESPAPQATSETAVGSRAEECVSEVKKRLIARWDLFVNGPHPEREADLRSWVAQGGWGDPAVATYIHYADAGRADLAQGESIMGLLEKREPQLRDTCLEKVNQQQ